MSTIFFIRQGLLIYVEDTKLSAIYKLIKIIQEEQRWQILQRHTVQREKLRIAYEQEILRTYANAKRLEENQSKPYSACMVLQAEFENQYELCASDLPPAPEGENKRWVYKDWKYAALVFQQYLKF